MFMGTSIRINAPKRPSLKKTPEYIPNLYTGYVAHYGYSSSSFIDYSAPLRRFPDQ